MDRAVGQLLEHPGHPSIARRRYCVGFARGANETDFFLFLPLARLSPRHARHFFGEVLRVG